MKANILIVDDSIISAQFFKNVLEQENLTVTISHSGESVVSLIEEHDIDIVLLDIVMPKTSGYDILALLQGNERTRDVPVVMITNLTSPLDVKKALDCGAMDFIRKTSEPIEVLARIHSALRLKHKQDLLRQNAQKDPLTQLYNKQFFNGTLERLIREKECYQQGLSLLIMDCDFFKRVNDRYGHMAGDMVLVSIANAIVKSVKTSDYVCRFGGEEFCVLFPDTSLFRAFSISERIRTNISKIPFILQDETVHITVSCGLSHTDISDDKSSLKLVNESDAALYLAKNNGRNQTVLFSGSKEISHS